MRTTVLICCITLIFFGCLPLLQRSDVARQADLGFPFELHENKSNNPPAWQAEVILDSKYYNKDNLDKLFTWYAFKKHPDRNEMLAIAVYTDPEQFKLYHENADDDMTEYGSRPHKLKYRSPPWDAYCTRKGEDLAAEGGDNLVYTYAPDLSIPSKTRRVVLRGRDYNADKKIIESWEAANANFKVSVESYELSPDVEPSGIYYTFSYAIRTSKAQRSTDISDVMNYSKPRAILTICQDKALPIPREQVNLISDNIGYAWMGWIYTVTTDGGRTWHQWDAETALPDWQCCDPGLIRDVNISFDGSGLMMLKSERLQPERVITLYTKDYGQHWGAY